MDTRQLRLVAGLYLLTCLATGCHETMRPLRYFGDANLNYYKDVASQIEYPHVETETADAVKFSRAPHRLGQDGEQFNPDNVWKMTLAEAIHTALQNNEIIRRAGGVLDDPDGTQSVYDPAIQETEPLFGVGRTGRRGIEDALSDFDARFTTNMLWGRSEQVQNNLFQSGGLPAGSTLQSDTGNFTARLEKNFAQSGQFAISHQMNYLGDNVPFRLFQSAYTGFLRAEYRQPLLAGSGAEYTRIAGPIGTNVGLDRGVVIARINNDISLADFEARVRDLLKEVEDAYWDLYLSYQVFHNEMLAKNYILEKWQQQEALLRTETQSKIPEAQARANYFDAEARVENALADIYANETRLRRLLGLPINEGKYIRPADEPTAAPVDYDWHLSLAEAITRRVELRRQKWRIKRLELQLRAAQNLVRPRLDFVSNYQVNAFGDQLFGYNDADGTTDQGFRSAYETLTQGNQTGWNLGFEFSLPLGLRSEHSQVRNIELRLAKDRAYLAAKELDIGHELAQALQQAARNYETAISNFNRQSAAKDQVESIDARIRFSSSGVERETLFDQLLRAALGLRDARLAYYSALIEYNKALADIHYRKGTLLELNNVHLAEGLWEPGAYQEALRRAYARSFGIDANHVHAEPEVFESHGYEEIELLIPEDKANSELGLPPEPGPNTDSESPQPIEPHKPQEVPVPPLAVPPAEVTEIRSVPQSPGNSVTHSASAQPSAALRPIPREIPRESAPRNIDAPSHDSSGIAGIPQRDHESEGTASTRTVARQPRGSQPTAETAVSAPAASVSNTGNASVAANRKVTARSRQTADEQAPAADRWQATRVPRNAPLLPRNPAQLQRLEDVLQQSAPREPESGSPSSRNPFSERSTQTAPAARVSPIIEVREPSTPRPFSSPALSPSGFGAAAETTLPEIVPANAAAPSPSSGRRVYTFPTE